MVQAPGLLLLQNSYLQRPSKVDYFFSALNFQVKSDQNPLGIRHTAY